MSEPESTLSEVAFRYPNLTILAYPQWDRIVLVPLGREPVAVTWGGVHGGNLSGTGGEP